MKINMISSLLFLLLTDFTLMADESRNESTVERLLIGNWQVVNLIIDPGKPFFGSREDKEFLDWLWDTRIKEALGSTVFIFKQDKSYIIRTKNDLKKGNLKGYWKLEDDGDVLVFYEKKKRPDKMKILLVDDKDLELLVNDGDPYMLVLKRQP